MSSKAVISLTTGLEDPEKVTVAFLVAVGAAESGRPTLMFVAKEAVRLATEGTATGVACEGCPPLAELVKRYEAAGGPHCRIPRPSGGAGRGRVGEQAAGFGDGQRDHSRVCGRGVIWPDWRWHLAIGAAQQGGGDGA